MATKPPLCALCLHCLTLFIDAEQPVRLARHDGHAICCLVLCMALRRHGRSTTWQCAMLCAFAVKAAAQSVKHAPPITPSRCQLASRSGMYGGGGNSRHACRAWWYQSSRWPTALAA